jgi:hypothetical protein
MPLPTFPWVTPEDSPRVGMRVSAAFLTEVTRARSGREKRRKVRPYPEHLLEMDFSGGEDTLAKANTLYAFFCARGGKFEAFVVFDCDQWRSYTGVRVGIATAAQTTIDLPSRLANSVTVKLNGVAKSGTFLALGGANGRDRFTLNVGAVGGEVITYDFTGQRSFVVRFDTDVLTIEYIVASLVYGGMAIPLVERFGEE